MHTYKTNGFTIVELLIVIVVIGILAAITLVAFSGVRDRANNSTIQSDIKNLASLIEQYRTVHGTTPPSLNGASFRAMGDFTPSKGSYGSNYSDSNGEYNLLYCANSNAFALIAASTSGTVYQYSTAAGGLGAHSGALAPAATTCPRTGIADTPTRQWIYHRSGWLL